MNATDLRGNDKENILYKELLENKKNIISKINSSKKL